MQKESRDKIVKRKRKAVGRKANVYSIEDGVSNSMMQCFLACETRMRNSLAGWEQSRPRRAIDYGQMWHEALEHWYIGGRKLEKFQPWFDGVWNEKAIKKFAVKQEDVEEDLAAFEILFPLYHKHWAKRDKKITWIDTEQTFDINWQGYRLRGKIDGVFRIGKKLWLFETKTKGRISEDGINAQLTFDPQNQFYKLAAEEIYGERVCGTLYNVIRKSGIKLGVDRDVQKWAAKLSKDANSKPEHYFKRFEVSYSQKQSKVYKDQLKAKLDMFSAWVASGMSELRRECSCTGRFNCEYLEACSNNSFAGYKQTKKLFCELEG